MSAIITMQNAVNKAFISSGGTEDILLKVTDGVISPKDVTHDIQARNIPFTVGPDSTPEFIMSKSNTHSEHFESPIRHAIVFTDTPDDIATNSSVFRFQFSLAHPNSRGEYMFTMDCVKGDGIYWDNKMVSYEDGLVVITTITHMLPGLHFMEDVGDPYQMYLSGQLYVTWAMHDKTISTIARSPFGVVCRNVIAENTMKLYKSPLPFIYEIKSYGEVSIWGRDYWWGSFDTYASASAEYSELLDQQMFSFNDNAFGNVYDLIAREDSWYGWNLAVSQHLNATAYSTKVTMLMHCLIGQNDFNQMILSRYCFWTGTAHTTYPNPWGHIFNDSRGLIKITDVLGKPLELPAFADVKLSEVELPGSSLKYWAASFKPNKEPPTSETEVPNVVVKVVFMGAEYLSLIPGFEMSFWARRVSPAHQVWVTTYTPHAASNCIHNLPIHRLYQLHQGGPTEVVKPAIRAIPELKFYLEKTYFRTVIEGDYEPGTNPFGYLAKKYTYEIKPPPEACTALTTTHNIQTSGIVIGANIESHAFNINRMGNDLDVINNEIRDIFRELQRIVDELAQITRTVTALNDLISVMLITDVVMGFATAGIGAIKGFFVAGAEGGFRIGTREAIAITEAGGKSTMSMGKGFDRIVMDGAIELRSLESTTGVFSTSLRVEGELLVNTIKNYVAGKITVGNVALFTVGLITSFIKFLETEESKIEMELLAGGGTIIALDFNAVKFFGTSASTAGHRYTGVATPDKSTWIASNMVTADLLTGLSNDPDVPAIKHFIGVIEGSTVYVRPDRSLNVINVYFEPKVTSGYLILEFTTDQSETLVNRFRIDFQDGVVTGTTVIEGFIPKDFAHNRYPPTKEVFGWKIPDEVGGYLFTGDFLVLEADVARLMSSSSDHVYNKNEVDALIQAACRPTSPLRVEGVAAPNTTITHLTTISVPSTNQSEGVHVVDFRVSYPVFASGSLGYPETLSPTDCICAVKPTGSYKELVGICVMIHDDTNEVVFASHGDYLFHVDNSSMYGIGDCIMYDGRTVNDEIPLTNRVARSIVGIITAKIDANTVAVFKS